MTAVQRIPTDPETCIQAIQAMGALYFIRDAAADCVKIGHSKWPRERLEALQVGNPTRLKLLGAVAAEPWVEEAVHSLCEAGHARGEWFYDRGILSAWLEEVTEGRPLYGWVWRLVKKGLFDRAPDHVQLVWRVDHG